MASETQVTSAAGGLALNKVLADIVQKVRDNAFLSQFCYWEDLTAKGAEAFRIPRETATPTMTEITPGATEADAQANFQLTSDSVTVTAAPYVVHFTISDWLEAVSAVDWTKRGEQSAVRAMATKIESLIATIFQGFSVRQGTTGQDTSVLAMDAALTSYGESALELAGTSAVIVLHRAQMGQLRQDLVSGSGSALSTVWGDGELANIFGKTSPSIFDAAVGKWYGVPLFQTSNVTKVNTDVDYCGAIFARSQGMSDLNCAIACAMKWLPTVEHFDKGSQNQIAHVTRGKMAVGAGEVLDGLGVGILGAV